MLRDIDLKTKTTYSVFVILSLLVFSVLVYDQWSELQDKTFAEFSEQSLLRSHRISHYLDKVNPTQQGPPPDEKEAFSGAGEESLFVTEGTKLIWGAPDRWALLASDPRLMEFLQSHVSQVGDFQIVESGALYFISLQKWDRYWILKMTPRRILDQVNKSFLIRVLALDLGGFLFLNLIFFLGVSYFARNLEFLILKIYQIVQTGPKDSQPLKEKEQLESVRLAIKKTGQQWEELNAIRSMKEGMEREMELTRNLQLTLLPPQTFSFEKFSLSAFYMPAELCGGDLYYYKRIGQKILVAIGDVTGHGISSSLLTASVRSTLSLIERDYRGLENSLLLLNHTTLSTTQSKQQMTFLLMEIDLQENRLKYVSASHEAPVVFIKNPDGHTFRVEALLENHSRRLGETEDFQSAPATEFKLEPGSFVLLYTDGLKDILGTSEKRIIKSLNQELDRGVGMAALRTNLIDRIQRQVANRHPPDDVSFVISHLL